MFFVRLYSYVSENVFSSVLIVHLQPNIFLFVRILQSSQQLTNHVVSICLTWRNNDGRCKLFVNSALSAMVDGFSKDFVIKSGSRVYLGGPPNQKRFVGLISHFNIWSHVLPTQVIAILGQRCGVERGDVIPWESFKINLGANINVVQDICSEQGTYQCTIS